jgi:hypothetical protein
LPKISPVIGSNASPGGRFVIDHVIVLIAPLAVGVCEYAAPTAVSGGSAQSISSGGGSPPELVASPVTSVPSLVVSAPVVVVVSSPVSVVAGYVDDETLSPPSPQADNTIIATSVRFTCVPQVMVRLRS